MPTNVGQRVFKKEIARFIPITGGDMIRLTLNLMLTADLMSWKKHGEGNRLLA